MEWPLSTILGVSSEHPGHGPKHQNERKPKIYACDSHTNWGWLAGMGMESRGREDKSQILELVQWTRMPVMSQLIQKKSSRTQRLKSWSVRNVEINLGTGQTGLMSCKATVSGRNLLTKGRRALYREYPIPLLPSLVVPGTKQLQEGSGILWDLTQVWDPFLNCSFVQRQEKYKGKSFDPWGHYEAWGHTGDVQTMDFPSLPFIYGWKFSGRVKIHCSVPQFP